MTAIEAPSILLVDDHVENLTAMEAALSPLGYHIVTATSGEAALRELLLAEFSLVILDVQMPGIDGFETARAIKGRPRTKDVPVLFLTAIGRDEDHRLHGYETGAVDYLFKPISPELLRAKASVFVQLHEQRVELERKTAALEQANRDLEQFTYIASHDLQEPLRVVSGYLELLASRGAVEDEQMRDWLQRATATTLRMGDLVHDLLICARAGANAGPITAVDVGKAAETAVEHLRMAIDEAGGRVEVSESMPAVTGVEVEVVQVLQNVIGNGLRHRGEDAPVVRIGAKAAEGVVEIEVEDNGPGVPEGDLDRIFGLFERVEGSPHPGTGLGLSICRRVVERRGGRIWMSLNKGAGATVHIALPAAGA
jgi:two-component system, sensor histidine kinase and response regulator